MVRHGRSTHAELVNLQQRVNDALLQAARARAGGHALQAQPDLPAERRQEVARCLEAMSTAAQALTEHQAISAIGEGLDETLERLRSTRELPSMLERALRSAGGHVSITPADRHRQQEIRRRRTELEELRELLTGPTGRVWIAELNSLITDQSRIIASQSGRMAEIVAVHEESQKVALAERERNRCLRLSARWGIVPPVEVWPEHPTGRHRELMKKIGSVYRGLERDLRRSRIEVRKITGAQAPASIRSAAATIRDQLDTAAAELAGEEVARLLGEDLDVAIRRQQRRAELAKSGLSGYQAPKHYEDRAEELRFLAGILGGRDGSAYLTDLYDRMLSLEATLHGLGQDIGLLADEIRSAKLLNSPHPDLAPRLAKVERDAARMDNALGRWGLGQ